MMDVEKIDQSSNSSELPLIYCCEEQNLELDGIFKASDSCEAVYGGLFSNFREDIHYEATAYTSTDYQLDQIR